MNLIELGRFLVTAGIVVIVIGFFFLMSDKLPLGRLPGDIRLGGGHMQVYIPLATCILISIIITIVFNFLFRK
jgi:hypothetical protein